MNSKNVILHLSLVPGILPGMVDRILKALPATLDLQDLYGFSVRDFGVWCSLSQAQAEKIVAGLSDTALLERELDDADRYAVQIITQKDPEYPALLKQIVSPPAVLYLRGDSSLLNSSCFSVVGSRDADSYGYKAIQMLVPPMVKKGYTIVSGGALGADAMAHQAALNAGGKTIAIIGSGLLKPYPLGNVALFAQIVDRGGLMVSHFPLNTDAHPKNFPLRNRLISGVSAGCLVVQAALRSGALITGHSTLEQGRELFVVPGCIDNKLSAGCHSLLQEGAKLTTSVHDILVELDPVYAASGTKEVQTVIFSPDQAEPLEPVGTKTRVLPAKKVAEKKIVQEELPPATVPDLVVHVCKEPQSVDDLAVITQLSAQELSAVLFDLQLAGRIQQTFAGLWQRMG